MKITKAQLKEIIQKAVQEETFLLEMRSSRNPENADAVAKAARQLANYRSQQVRRAGFQGVGVDPETRILIILQKALNNYYGD